jgi:acyl-coenzyme A synthetase/AMP-(fatty) acid ligase
VAVDRSLTFNDLDLESNIIANELIKRGLRKGDKVLIVLNRDSKLISSIFGVIKAGGVFIIVSPDDPTHRINFIKDQTDTRFLISFKVFIDKTLPYSKDLHPYTYFENNSENNGNSFCNKYSKSNGTYCIDINGLINGENERLPHVDLKSADILCIVYTSGSTGSPKGVTLSHNSIPDTNSLRSIFKLTNLNFGGDDKYLLDLGQNFTVAFFSQLLIFLSYGITIVLNNEKQLTDPRELFSLYERTKFNMIVTVPSKLNEYLELDQIKDLIKKLKMIVFLGEKHTPDLINRIKSLNKDISLVNVYGSSETFLSNIKLIYEYNQFIGKPVQFFNEIVADLDNNPLPQGIAGELLIGGKTLAENYYDDEELTKKKFIKIKDTSFFKTGELVKSVGEDFVLLGRLDNQIKLRGQRIDPGEIENNVPEDIGVEKAIVTINNKNNDQVLTLYFTTKSKSLMNDEIVKIKEMIKGHLVDKLPGFMVPQVYVYLEEFPKTSTGKVNVKDLKNHDDNIKEIVKPSTDLERELFDLCVDILGYDDFGVTNSLISIGLTSLSMIKLLNKILVEYKLYLIFEEAYNMNILEISKIIENKGSTYTKYELRDCYPLTSIQSNYYNFIKENFDSLLPNLCYVLTFKDVDVFKMKDALIKTIEVNNYIKTSFIIVDDTVYQKRNDDYKVDIKIFNKKLTEKIEKKFLKPFDIFEPPLFRFELYYHNNKVNLLMDIHHIIADLLSIDIFIMDLIKEYYSDSVDIKEYDYFDYTLDQVNINPIDKEKSKNYFLKQVANFHLGFYNNPTPINEEYTFSLKSIVLKDSFAIFLKRYKVSEHDLFLSAIVICLTKFLNVNNILINFVFNGRDDSRSFNAFGYFARSIPLFLEVNDNIYIKDFLNSLKDLKESYINNSRYFNPEDLIKDYLTSKRKIYIQYNYFGDIFDNRDNNYLDDSYSKKPIQYNKMLNEDDSYFFYFDKNVVKDFELYCGYVNAYNNGYEIDNLLKNIDEVVKLIVDNPQMIIHDLFQLLGD